MGKCIVIPDVHGRSFWREAVKELDGQAKVVFLGDYVDPYRREGILPEEALAGLEEIIDLKKKYPDRVVLLLGNHDLGYLDPDINTCRRDSFRAMKLNRLFGENLDLFDLVHIDTISGKQILFSHAGIAVDWVRRHNDIVDADRPERLNELLHSADREALFRALADASWYRGGSAPVGSPVWADVDEYRNGTPLLPGYYHIFGHTFQPYGPVRVGDQGVCVDCGRAYIINAPLRSIYKHDNHMERYDFRGDPQSEPLPALGPTPRES